MNHQTRSVTLKKLEDLDVRSKLEAIMANPAYSIEATTYSANSALYPDGQIPFVEKHIAYLMSNPGLDPIHYLANLRLKLRHS